MMSKTILKGFLAFLLSSLASLAFAHHGNFTYDGNTVITIEGVVIEFNWSNPHGSIVLRTDNGREVKVEIDGPSLIRPMGVTPRSLVRGERIVAYVSPSNRGRDNDVLGREVIKEDGSLLKVSVAYARRQASEDKPVASSLIGLWVPDRTNLFAFVASSQTWSLTPAGQASFDAYDVSESFAQAECIASTTPTLMMYPTANVLTESDGHIEINADWMGATRTVYMDGRPHPRADTLLYQGHSVGHWEEGALVIETTNFMANAIGNVFSIASGVNKKVEERISLDAGGSTATYAFTLTDPEYLAEPVSGSYTWEYRPDVSASSEACDLDSARAFLEE